MYNEEYQRWLAADLQDADLSPELRKIQGNDEEIKDRFAVSLQFGTAGLRGVLGAGTNRMNIYVVAQATQGLANWVKTQGGNQTVAISFDTRLKSDVFSKTAAGVLAVCVPSDGVLSVCALLGCAPLICVLSVCMPTISALPAPNALSASTESNASTVPDVNTSSASVVRLASAVFIAPLVMLALSVSDASSSVSLSVCTAAAPTSPPKRVS